MPRTMPYGRRAISVATGLGLLVALQGCALPAKEPPRQAMSVDCSPGPDGADPADADGGPRLGCVNRKNLARMVATPTDLVRGQDLGPADGARQAMAVDAYLQGRIKSASGAGSSTPNYSPLSTAK